MASTLFDRHHIPQLSSTNKELNNSLMRMRLDEGYLISTDYQLGGKGQGDAIWESEKGKNLLFSTLLRPNFLDISRMFYITAIVSLSIIDVVEKKYGLEDLKIKWPNDIYVGKRKLAGILIENAIKGSIIESSIIGIGINVNQVDFLSDAPNPISLAMLNPNVLISTSDLLDDFESSLIHRYTQLKEEKFDLILADYLSVMYQRGIERTYKLNGRSINGVILGVDEFGFLSMNIDGEDYSFDVKEIVYT